MEIPLNAHVFCSDGSAGHVTRIVLNPLTQTTTDIVVRESSPFGAERVVPIESIVESTHDRVTLRLTRKELAAFQRFMVTEYVALEHDEPEIGYGQGYIFLWPWSPFGPKTMAISEPGVPPEELSVRRGFEVDATDGRVGTIDEFMVNPEHGTITHLVVRAGHLWGAHDVTIPISQIASIDAGSVRLKLDKHAVAGLARPEAAAAD